LDPETDPIAVHIATKSQRKLDVLAEVCGDQAVLGDSQEILSLTNRTCSFYAFGAANPDLQLLPTAGHMDYCETKRHVHTRSDAEAEIHGKAAQLSPRGLGEAVACQQAPHRS
jgi:hypothetical protein